VRKVTRIDEVRAALAEPRRDGRTIGLVPTMGALHEGHLSLMRRAQDECDVVVVSLFVNPAQFDERSDLDAYPRDEQRDAMLAAEAGVDLLFAPAPQEIYPPGFATTVSVTRITETLEGAHRGAGHFDGVSTVVTKLLNIVAPDVAYFGQKDAQQALVIKRLVSDLDIPVLIEVCPTVREDDGLALSSRNSRLSREERRRAAALHRALARIAQAAHEGELDAATARSLGIEELDKHGVEAEYLELVAADSLEPVVRIDGEVLAVVAARVGDTRLIDNEVINANGRR
jgi:pantoate--beta-alanine ligase